MITANTSPTIPSIMNLMQGKSSKKFLNYFINSLNKSLFFLFAGGTVRLTCTALCLAF